VARPTAAGFWCRQCHHLGSYAGTTETEVYVASCRVCGTQNEQPNGEYVAPVVTIGVDEHAALQAQVADLTAQVAALTTPAPAPRVVAASKADPDRTLDPSL
jgi:transcription elongation factor Elf1